MSTRTARWLAWPLVGGYFVLAAIGLTLQYVSQMTFVDLGFPFLIVITVVVGLWCSIGALIISHQPRHPIGWITLLAVTAWGPDSSAFGYVSYSLISDAGSSPLVDLALVWLSWTGFPFAMLALTLLFLLFPTGHPLSPRWGRLAWIGTGALIPYLILKPLSPNALEQFSLPLTSPLAVPASVWAVLNPLWWIALIVLASCVLAASSSLLLRLRWARGEERQQIKWFVYAAAFFPLSIPGVAYVEVSESTKRIALYLSVGFHLFSIAAIAIAIAFAIFKYRLYDIDVIINRTLVYGGLTGTLAVVYFGSVVLLQRLLPAESQLAIVISTLAIAALFNPLRRRIQNDIDRRFYRRKYDAQQVLAAFAETARDETDLDRLTDELIAVVEETMQPAHVSLWLRDVQSGSGQQGEEAVE